MKFMMAQACVFLLAAATTGRAASFTITPEVTAAFNLDGTPALLPDIHSLVGHPLIYQVDFNFTISNLSASEGGIGDLEMDVNLTAGLTDQSGWSCDESTTQQTPGGPVEPLWDMNGDYGPNTHDLKAIVAVLGESRLFDDGITDATDPRALLGQDAPGHIGHVDVLWDGVSSQTLSLANVQYATLNSAFNRYGNGHSVDDTHVIQFGEVVPGFSVAPSLASPEPGTVGIMAASCALWMRRARRVAR
jgi:hypothetical protein